MQFAQDIAVNHVLPLDRECASCPFRGRYVKFIMDNWSVLGQCHLTNNVRSKHGCEKMGISSATISGCASPQTFAKPLQRALRGVLSRFVPNPFDGPEALPTNPSCTLVWNSLSCHHHLSLEKGRTHCSREDHLSYGAKEA